MNRSAPSWPPSPTTWSPPTASNSPLPETGVCGGAGLFDAPEADQTGGRLLRLVTRPHFSIARDGWSWFVEFVSETGPLP